MGKISVAVLSIIFIFALTVAEKDFSHEQISNATAAATSGVQQELSRPDTLPQEEDARGGLSARTASDGEMLSEHKTGRRVDINMGSFLSAILAILYLGMIC